MMQLKARLDSPFLPLLIVAVLISLFTFGMLRRVDFDASWFITAGDKFCDPVQVPQNLTVRRNSDGFDGQFYYRLALDPLTSKRTDHGVTLDLPAVRHQRIVYPLIARMLSFGNARLLPPVLLLINFSALCFLGWLGGTYAQSMKQHALWGIFLPLYPGALLSFTRDLVELSEISLLVSSLLLLRRGKHLTATLLLVLAVLAKETALLVAVAALLVFVIDHFRKHTARVKWYYFAAPLATYALWQIILFNNWGEFPLLAGKINIATPFTGFVGFLMSTSPYQTPLQRRAFPELIFLIGFAASVLYCVRSTRSSLVEVCSWLLYLFLALSLSRAIWTEDWTFLRAVTELCVLGTIILIGCKSKIRIPVFGCSLMFWLFLFVRLLRHGD